MGAGLDVHGQHHAAVGVGLVQGHGRRVVASGTLGAWRRPTATTTTTASTSTPPSPPCSPGRPTSSWPGGTPSSGRCGPPGRPTRSAEVKALRKPKAVARALERGRPGRPERGRRPGRRGRRVGEAQSDGGDVRGALDALRGRGAGGHRRHGGRGRRTRTGPPDASTLGAAVRAVLADPEALAALRAVRLVDVPAGGGLGLAGLGGATAAPPPERARAERPAGRASERRGRGLAPGPPAATAPGAPAAEAASLEAAGKTPQGRAEGPRRRPARRGRRRGGPASRRGALDEATGAVAAAESDERDGPGRRRGGRPAGRHRPRPRPRGGPRRHRGPPRGRGPRPAAATRRPPPSPRPRPAWPSSSRPDPRR